MKSGLASVNQSCELFRGLFFVKVIVLVNLKVELVKLTQEQPVDLIAMQQRLPVNVLKVPDQVEQDGLRVDELLAF